jgi:hypothetical protein
MGQSNDFVEWAILIAKQDVDGHCRYWHIDFAPCFCWQKGKDEWLLGALLGITGAHHQLVQCQGLEGKNKSKKIGFDGAE